MNILYIAFNETIAAIESSGSQLLCSFNDGEHNVMKGNIKASEP